MNFSIIFGTHSQKITVNFADFHKIKRSHLFSLSAVIQMPYKRERSNQALMSRSCLKLSL